MPEMIMYICVQSESCRHVCAAWRDCVRVESEPTIWNLEGSVASAAAAALLPKD